MKFRDIDNTIKYIEKMSIPKMIRHPCIGDKYELLNNGIQILKKIMKIIPIKNIIVTQKSLRDAIINEISERHEKKHT